MPQIDRGARCLTPLLNARTRFFATSNVRIILWESGIRLNTHLGIKCNKSVRFNSSFYSFICCHHVKWLKSWRLIRRNSHLVICLHNSGNCPCNKVIVHQKCAHTVPRLSFGQLLDAEWPNICAFPSFGSITPRPRKREQRFHPNVGALRCKDHNAHREQR